MRHSKPAGVRRIWVSLAPDAAVLLGFLVLAVYSTWPMARYLGSRVVGLGDPLEAVWIFAWGAHALVHQPFALFDANIFSPERYTLAYAENLLGVSIPAAPIFWISGNGILTYNVAMLFVLAVGGFGSYLLVRELGRSPAAAILAGAAFTCAPYRLAAAGGHPHVAAVHVLPFVLLVLMRMRLGVTRRRVIALGFLLALQWWTSLTGGVLTTLTVALWAVWETARLRRRALPLLRRAGVGLVLGLALSAPVLIPYVRVRQQHPGFSHETSEAVLYSARPQSYLSPVGSAGPLRSASEVLSERFADNAAPGEKTLFPGFWLTCAFVASMVAVTVTLISRRGRAHWVEPVGLFVTMGLAGFILSLGPRAGPDVNGALLPFALLDAVIPGSLLRVPARMGLLVLIAIPLVVGLVVSRVRPPLRLGVVAVSLGLLVLELAPSRSFPIEPPSITPAHAAVVGRQGAVLALPTAEMASETRFVYGGTDRENIHMYFSTAHFRPLTNGYAAYFPPSYFAMVRAAGALPSADSFRTLRQRNVQTVIVQTELLAGTRWVGIEERLRAWPGVRVLARASGVIVFDVSRAKAVDNAGT